MEAGEVYVAASAVHTSKRAKKQSSYSASKASPSEVVLVWLVNCWLSSVDRVVEVVLNLPFVDSYSIHDPTLRHPSGWLLP